MATKIAELFVKIGADISEFQAKTKQIDSSWKKVGQQMVDVGSSMSMYITAPLTALGIASMNTFGQYEKAMNMVRGLTSATADDFSRLDETAKRLGATTQYSAVQAAEAMQFLGMAGFDTNQIIGAMPGTLQLAASAHMDMATAADIVTNILTGYNLKVEELARVNDVLVKAFTSANTNLQQLGEAMQYAGPVASSAGVAFEEATAALALMGNAGIQASMAGTSLRGAITRVLNPTKQVADAMKQAGLNFTDAEGRLLPLAEIIEQLGPHAEDTGLLMQIFGQRAGPAFAGLVTQGADALRELTAELVESEGAAKRMAEVQVEGWTGAWIRLKSALEGVFISIGETLAPVLSTAAEFITSLMTAFIELEQPTKNIIAFFAALAAAAGPFLVTLGSILKIIPLITPAIALLSGPVGLAVAAITALGVAAASVYANWDKLSGWFSSSASPIFGQIGQTAKNTGSAISSAFASAWDGVKNAISSIVGALEPQLKILSASFAALGQAIATALGFAATTIGNTLSAVVSIVGGALGAIGHLVAGIVQVLTGDFAGAWESLRSAAISVWDGLVRAFVAGVDTLLAGIGALIGFLPGVSEGIDRARASLQGLIPVRDIQKDAETASGAIYGLGDAAIQVGAGIGVMAEKPRAGIGVLKNDITGLGTVLATVPEAAEKAGEGAAKGLEQPIESALDKIKQSLNDTMAVFDREVQLGVRMHMDDAATARVKHEIDSVRSAIESIAKDTSININSSGVQQLQQRLIDLRWQLIDLRAPAQVFEVDLADGISTARKVLGDLSADIQRELGGKIWGDLMAKSKQALGGVADDAKTAEDGTKHLAGSLQSNLIGALMDSVSAGRSFGETLNAIAQNAVAMIPGFGGIAKQVLGFMDSIGLGLDDMARKLANAFRPNRGDDPVAEWYREIERTISNMRRLGASVESIFADLKIQFPDVSEDILRAMIEGTSNALADYQAWLGTFRPAGMGNSVKVLNEWLFEELEKGLSTEGAMAAALTRAAQMSAKEFEDLFGIRRDKWGKNDQYQGVFAGVMAELLKEMERFGVDFTKALDDIVDPAVAAEAKITAAFESIGATLSDSLRQISDKLDIGLISDADAMTEQMRAYERALNAMISANLSKDDPRYVAIYDAWKSLNDEIARGKDVAAGGADPVDALAKAWEAAGQRLAETLANIRERANVSELNVTVADVLKEEARAYQKAIEDFLRIPGALADDPRIEEWRSALARINEQLAEMGEKTIEAKDKITLSVDKISETLQEKLGEIDISLKYNFAGSEQDFAAQVAKLQAQMKAYSDAIDRAGREGLTDEHEFIQQLKNSYKELADELERLRGDAVAADISGRFDAVTASLEKLETRYKLLGDTQEYFAEKAKLLKKAITDLADVEGIDPDDSRLLELSAQYQAAAEAAKALADNQKQIDATVRGAIADGNEAVVVTMAERAIELWRTADALIKEVTTSGIAWVGQWQTDVMGAFAALLGDAHAFRTEAFDDMRAALGTYVAVLSDAFAAATAQFDAMRTAITDFVSNSNFGQIAKDIITEIAPELSQLVYTWQNGVRATLSSIGEIARSGADVFAGLLDYATTFADRMAGAFQNAVAQIRDALAEFGEVTATVQVNGSAMLDSVPAFASGGVVFGKTLGLLGEYPGSGANPEIIAPLDRLKSLLVDPTLESVSSMAAGGGGQQIQVYLDGRIITEAVVMHTPDVVRITTGGVY